MNILNRLFRYFIIGVSLSLLACNGENNSVDNKAPDVITNKAHQYIGKPHAPIEMDYKVSTKQLINVGESLRYKIYFSSSIAADELQVSYTIKGDLLLQNSATSTAFGAQKKAQKNLLELEVIPQQEGLFYIYLSATLHVDGELQSRSFAIPVKVGEQISPALIKTDGSSQNDLQQDEDEQKIISMPAIETVN